MPPPIAVSGLTKRYDKFLAVDGLSFEVHAGEIFGLLGPNGAGKTSTLKMLAGVMAPTGGSILIDGIDAVANPQAAKREIGFLPQDPYAYEKLTGREFLHFIAEVRGMPLAERRPLFDHWFDLFELAKDADKLIEGYSGGMLKKLLLIATFLHDPPVLLLDEPTIELDPLTVRRVRRHIEDRAAAGRAVLLSTHVLEIAERM
ncbi:MAG TPA: ABC transporter ATP-binding protein, partial [bacterium]|nr:ABC transporter ATP-binding protein [bacterium]